MANTQTQKQTITLTDAQVDILSRAAEADGSSTTIALADMFEREVKRLNFKVEYRKEKAINEHLKRNPTHTRQDAIKHLGL